MSRKKGITASEKAHLFAPKDSKGNVKVLTREEIKLRHTDPLAFQQSLIKQRIESIKEDLPHLYGWKWYPWAREFFESRNKMNLLVAGNQLGKSSTAIRKNIEWACNKKLWPELWETTPRQFWYFYPSEDIATIEVEKKWIPEFLPRGEMKHHEEYGWDLEYSGGEVSALHFRSGVSIYFKSYGQKTMNLQTATVHMVTCFTAGHLIITSNGIRKIEDIKVGDYVLGNGCWNMVTQALVQEGSVSTKYFSNGESLEATGEHPIWTYNRGWVRFSDLTVEDVIASFPLWKIIKRLYILGVHNTTGSRTVPIIGCAITLGVKALRQLACYMSICGKLIIKEESPKGQSSITRISILWTILSKIWSCSHGLNTLAFTKKMSGSQGDHQNTHVLDAVKNSYQDRRRRQVLNVVQGDVGEGLLKRVALFVRKNFSAILTSQLIFVLKHASLFIQRSSKDILVNLVLDVLTISGFGQARLKHIAQESVQTRTKAIHTLTVTGSKTYISNGIHCHNCDEELIPIHIDELLARLRGTRGYFNQVFTATSGYPIWYRAMECIGQAEETFPNAWKKCASMRDSQYYDDGTPSPWTNERIKEAEGMCSSQAEILKRIDGRFIVDEGRRYLSFDPDKNLISSEVKIEKEWRYYAGVDIGSGGKGRSAGAIVIIAVAPDLCSGRVVRTWRGDHEETTARDILDKYKELRIGISITQACYDYQSREFGLIASRSGEPFSPADKARGSGEQIINTLFSSGSLVIDDGAYDNRKLVTELMSVPAGSKNRKFQDDLTDAMRYVIMLIPWDFSKIAPNLKFKREEDTDESPKKEWTEKDYQAWEIRQRRGEMSDDDKPADEWHSFAAEVSAWNDAYGN